MYNRVVLIGRLGKDPEHVGTENKVAKLSVATSTYKKKPDGTFEEFTEWNRVVVFGEQAERVTRMVKGDIVMVEGTLRTSKYTDKNGVERYSTDVVGIAKKISGTGAPASPAKHNEEAVASPDLPIKDDDLPF